MKSRTHSYIVFIDETGFMLAPTVRRTWAPRGQTPILKTGDPHAKISAIGAMALQRSPMQFSFYFHLLEDNANFGGRSIASFVKHLHKILDGPITIVWDEYCIHRASPVKQYLRRARSIEVFEFPPYAPELNPVDYVWSYVKYGRLANYCPMNLAQLRKRITEELEQIAKQPGLLRALFDRTKLPLDGLDDE